MVPVSGVPCWPITGHIVLPVIAYQRSIGGAQDAVDAAAELRIRAERRMGEELAKAELRGGDRKSKVTSCDFDRPNPTLADIGVTKMQSSRYQHLAAIPADTFETVVEAHKAAGEPISTASIARTADALETLPSSSHHAPPFLRMHRCSPKFIVLHCVFGRFGLALASL